MNDFPIDSERAKVLLIDDEEHFRIALKDLLSASGYDVIDIPDGQNALRIIRHQHPEVVVLDMNIPNDDSIQTLRDIKHTSPEVQVIMMTGHGCESIAKISGKHDVFKYLAKPCGISDLGTIIEEAREARRHYMAHHDIPQMPGDSFFKWFAGVRNLRPGVIIFGLAIMLLFHFMPVPKSLVSVISAPKTGVAAQDTKIVGYSGYREIEPGQSIYEYFGKKTKMKIAKPGGAGPPGDEQSGAAAEHVARKAMTVLGILVMCVLFWATGALPIGITAFFALVLMYVFTIMPPDMIVKAHAKDSVLFIIGVLALSKAITKTGLDKRIGLILLASSKSLKGFLFVFGPLLAVTASFISEHALVAFMIPVVMIGYSGMVRAAGVARDRSLMVLLLLFVCFTANIGGPGSPAAGGRNAIMIGILSDYGIDISFGQWVKYGLPFVPVCALAVAMYFYIAFRKKLAVKSFDLIAEIRKEAEKIGRMTRNEYITAATLVVLIVMLITLGENVGLGGAFILAVVFLNLAGILQWRDVNSIHWDVAAMYASASAIGSSLALCGASLWLADSFTSVLPEYFQSGNGLAISSSFITGLLTNFMSDGATVATVGPITVPLATMSGTSPIMIGLATAFSSSFAHLMIIGTPNNALAYAMAKDAETGEQLLTVFDFLKHGFFVLLICWAVLWLWAFFGYWLWIGF